MNDDYLQSLLATYERALKTLHEALALRKDTITRDAAIQRFEFCFELTWKVLKHFAEKEGLEVNSPKSALRAAFQLKWIQDDALWLQMLEDRNLTSHTYNEELAERIYESLSKYSERMTSLHGVLKSKN